MMGWVKKEMQGNEKKAEERRSKDGMSRSRSRCERRIRWKEKEDIG